MRDQLACAARRSRRGIATVTTIVLLSIAAVTVTILATTFAMDVRRTQAVAEEAQLSELLHVGALVGMEKLNGNGNLRDQKSTVSLPAGLKGYEVQLSYEVVKPRQSVALMIRASHGGRYVEERVVCRQDAGVWRVARVEEIKQSEAK